MGKAPEVFIHLEDEGTIQIKAPTKITMEAPECEVNASTSFTVNSAQINLNGPISGGGSGGADATFTGDVNAKASASPATRTQASKAEIQAPAPRSKRGS